MGDVLSQLAADIFGPVVVEAVLFLCVFIVLLGIIGVVLDITNLQTKGGE